MSKSTKSTMQGSNQADFDPLHYTHNGLSEDEVLEIKEAFDLFDKNHTGCINAKELKEALLNMGIDPKNRTLKNMIDELDKKASN